ncbi:uncharacterized protein LOC112588525 [Harpegnathos saltator]|uniref:uncharacterized protein LOC112588525 n=1 Tax=Harpegnathos saltator TaxID=610380 RepID=UPI000DBEDBE0|nr:uncharacterized protein LOC112588525 [Harpegnathos saltator]
MICNARTCTECRYLKDDERQDDQTSFAEFLANCQHAKCKVVRLVRQQISKLQNMQVGPAFSCIRVKSTKRKMKYKCEAGRNEYTNTATLSRRTVFPERAVGRKWMLWVLSRVRHRAHLMLAAAVVGVIVWSALVYGPCFLSSLKYTRAKRSLF